MSEIPESVWAAARELRGAVNWNSNASIEIIARALMARDERAARIARGTEGGWNNTSHGRSVSSRIAAAILSEDQSHDSL